MPYALMKNKSKHLLDICIWLIMFNFLIIIFKIKFTAQVFFFNFFNFLLGRKNFLHCSLCNEDIQFFRQANFELFLPFKKTLWPLFIDGVQPP